MDENVETIISNKVIGIIHSFQSEIIVLINRNTVETAYILFKLSSSSACVCPCWPVVLSSLVFGFT